MARDITALQHGELRFVLEALGTKVVVTTEGTTEVEFTIPTEVAKDATGLSVPRNAKDNCILRLALEEATL